MPQKENVQQASTFKVVNAAAGSGKTFTLVKAYLKILLSSKNPNKFQEILAVTFTNKAAGEMKERVIQMLNDFSKNRENDMLGLIIKETALQKEVIFKRSERIIKAIFRRYGSFNIVTIDSFTHHLIRTFAFDLKLPLNFEVELDAENLLSEAVDLVIAKIGEDKRLTDQLVNFAYEKMDADKSWDVSYDLKAFSSLILNENNSIHFQQLKSVEAEAFNNLKNKLQRKNAEIVESLADIGKQGSALIRDAGLADKDFYYSLIPKHFHQLKVDFKNAKFFDQNKLKERLEEGVYYSKSKPDAIKATIEGIMPELLDYYKLSEKLYKKKIRNDLVLSSLNPLAVLNHIYSALDEIKEENNVLLNAEFNEMISETIKNEPTPFIYERLGDKFRYYFIDEMQDTSVRQWQNLIPLAENALSSENEIGESGELVMVGDAKQAIYRWRGGKAEQYIALASDNDSLEGNPFFVNKKVIELDTNYRSYSEIIDFNNTFFKYVSQGLSNESYKKLYLESSQQLESYKKGGYVQLSFIKKEAGDDFFDQIVPKKVYEIITELGTDYQRNELCVLVRTKKQGIAVANYLSANDIDIISSETLLIENSENVQFIIDLLYSLLKPGDEDSKIRCLYFLYEHLGVQISQHDFYKELIHKKTLDFFIGLEKFGSRFNLELYLQKSLYESIEYIIRSFKLSRKSDANLQFFLDVVYEFQLKNQSDLAEFLNYWELKKDKLSIVAPEADNAVRIMTIHKAKGLEFPVVIFPYDMELYRQIDPKVWYNLEDADVIKSTLISYNKNLKNIDRQGTELYERRREELELDTINLLYVTMTRAKEQLYVITEKSNPAEKEELNRSSLFFINYLSELGIWNDDTNEYYFGKKRRFSDAQNSEENRLVQKTLISAPWNEQKIAILAKSNVLWGSEQGRAIDYGNLLHELLAKINTQNDIDEVINQYVFNGLISEQESSTIVETLNSLVQHNDLQAYFDYNSKVLCEQEIISKDAKILIPDRLVFKGNKVAVLEYKTGRPEKKHIDQVTNYAHVLKEMGYEIDQKILIYLNEKITIKTV